MGSIPTCSTKRTFMFDKFIVWLKESFKDMEESSIFTNDFVNCEHRSFFDGADLVSTWRDNESGNTVDDDRKSHK